MEQNEEVKGKWYGWQELGLLYAQDLAPESAARRIRRWVDHNPELTRELTEAGWKKGNRLLTPVQKNIITRYMGEP